ncbi:tetratricopeptide repeat protein [Pseudoalteromonas sp. JBTF-M23]|uniref:Ancillary SecYEG translocon subunit n=1 Tax=Pseudoalteromonas caenipelagi TaxID=2726988 RepID=A0A849VK73_9GAMM|nr:tetratricopeptide repeat protein [Pseudoalteromonas caenipelagi]NOU52017.1 tetratricopeptide repeat protein [Pseudoalteromonas caenipelagi]
MEIYSTEEQQAEAIKRFFRENGVSLALGIIIGLGGLYGWKAYNQSQIDSAEAASNAYNQFVESEDVLAVSDSFVKENGDSNYAVLAAFVAAKEAAEKQQLDVAAQKLQWAADNVQNLELKATAITRLARVQLAQQQFEEALATLDKPMPESFKAQISEIKGDIFLAQGDKEQAKSQYQAALEASTEGSNTLLKIKLDDLASAQPAA